MAAPDYEAWLTSAATAEPGPAAAKKRKGTAKKEPKTAGAGTYPPTLLAALQCETSWLQNLGWSQPPGSRRVTYWRPRDVLDSAGPAPSVRHGSVLPADTALLALASDTSRGEVLPLFSRALPQAELLHRSLISLLGDPPPDCPELAGRSSDGSPLQGHHHAHFVPLDRVLVHAPMGLGSDAQSALRRLRRTWTKGGDRPLFVTLAGVGALRDFARIGSSDVPELATATRWVSRTPFVPPRFVKVKKHTVEDQVRAELVSRGLPRAARVDISITQEAWGAGFHRFVRARRAGAPQPPADAVGRSVCARPPRPPLCLHSPQEQRHHHVHSPMTKPWTKHLVATRDICSGTICARGTRIPVAVILDSLAEGASEEQTLRSFPRFAPSTSGPRSPTPRTWRTRSKSSRSPTMRMKLDENLPDEIAADLPERSHDSATVDQERLAGRADRVSAARAGAILVLDEFTRRPSSPTQPPSFGDVRDAASRTMKSDRAGGLRS